MTLTTLSAYRLATPDDAPAIGAFQVRAWRDNYSELLPSWVIDGFSAEERVAAWRQILRRPSFHDNAFVVVAGDDSGIAVLGAASNQRSPKLKALGYTGQIEAIYVRKDLQHHGLGLGLLRRMFIELGARGHKTASHWLMRCNQRGVHFLETTGAQLLNVASNARDAADDLAYGWRDIGRPDTLSWQDPRSRLITRKEEAPRHLALSMGQSADLAPEHRRSA